MRGPARTEGSTRLARSQSTALALPTSPVVLRANFCRYETQLTRQVEKRLPTTSSRRRDHSLEDCFRCPTISAKPVIRELILRRCRMADVLTFGTRKQTKT